MFVHLSVSCVSSANTVIVGRLHSLFPVFSYTFTSSCQLTVCLPIPPSPRPAASVAPAPAAAAPVFHLLVATGARRGRAGAPHRADCSGSCNILSLKHFAFFRCLMLSSPLERAAAVQVRRRRTFPLCSDCLRCLQLAVGAAGGRGISLLASGYAAASTWQLQFCPNGLHERPIVDGAGCAHIHHGAAAQNPILRSLCRCDQWLYPTT